MRLRVQPRMRLSKPVTGKGSSMFQFLTKLARATKRPARKAPSSRRARPGLELLEGRALPAGSISLSPAGTLWIIGSNFDDAVTVNAVAGQVQVVLQNLNGPMQTLQAAY